MRDQIVAGNWKMNNDQNETQTLLNALKSHSKPKNVRVMVAPSFTQLSQSVSLLGDDVITVAAQNVNAAASGAYTGEVSVSMLKGVGVETVLLLHQSVGLIFVLLAAPQNRKQFPFRIRLRCLLY